MPYASLDPALWDDAGFVKLSDQAQLLYIYLLVGPEALLCVPGLVIGEIQSLSAARRKTAQDTYATLSELSVAGWVNLDGEHRLIEVPRGPENAPPGSTNVVKGWWRRWRTLPDCRVKFAHLDPLRVVVCEVRGWTEVWAATFGTVRLRTTSALADGQKADKGAGVGSNVYYMNDRRYSESAELQFGEGQKYHAPDSASLKADSSTSVDSQFGEGSAPPTGCVARSSASLEANSSSGVESQFGEGCVNPTRDFAGFMPTVRKATDPRSEIRDQRSEIRDPDPEGECEGEGKREVGSSPLAVGTQPGTEPSPIAAKRKAARALWALQEELMADLPYENRACPEPTEDDLQVVSLALDSYQPDELEYVQRLFAERAQEDPKQARWFNRRANWHPAQIERAIRTPMSGTGKGPVRAGRKRFTGRWAFDTP